MNSPGWQVPNIVLEISGEITLEKMNRQSQSQKKKQKNKKTKKNPLVDVTGDVSKV